MEQTDMDRELHNESGQLLLNYIKGEDIDGLRVKAAMSAYNGSTRAMSTLRVTQAMQLAIIKEMAKNKEEVRKYIKATSLSEYMPSKFLE